MDALTIRREALRLLGGESAILDIAREVSRIMRDARIDGAIIGGVAVVLHGHIRTTVDVDVFVPLPLEQLREPLERNGYQFDAVQREFRKQGIPVHLVSLVQLGQAPERRVEIDEITTVSLADLVNMKLRSGSTSVVRSQDLADVIGLIRHHNLSGKFAPKIHKELREEFRRLVRAVKKDSG